MRMISFDVGIKNMAFCIFDVSFSQVSILQWGILNLMDDLSTSSNNKPLCNCVIPPKTKKGENKTCNSIAKYYKNTMYFCNKHASKNNVYIVREKECTPSAINKLKLDGLRELFRKYNLSTPSPTPETKMTRPELISFANDWFSTHCYDVVETKKNKRADEYNLVDIGKNLKKKLGEIQDLDQISLVLIENQISPIANRMKTIQGMLAQYFIMINDQVQIEFVSSSNKLGQLTRPDREKMESKTNEKTSKTEEKMEKNDSFSQSTETKPNKYKQNKKDGIQVCGELLDQYESFHSWRHVLENKKRDDLADCFLQGIWYLRKTKQMT